MDCDKCGADPVMHAAYSGQHLCESHLRESVERRVRRRVREDNLLPDGASPDDPETWVIGLSGGKDSVVLATILHETFDVDPRVELMALSIHEGIEGYRDESLAACEDLTADLGIRHEVVTYESEFGVRMDDVVADDPMDMSACGYCGVFRRDVLARHARNLDADKLLTGHNLDDEAETALMNVLEGDVAQMAQHFDASLGPFPSEDPAEAQGERGTGPPTAESGAGRRDGSTRRVVETFVPRAKPLRDVPEKEVALYAQLRDLPVHMATCPHSDEAFRGEIQSLLLDLEDRHPGTRHSILAGYEQLAGLAAAAERDEGLEFGNCEECGAATARDVCRTCALLEALA
ncbi:MAG: TIGR00269 family protein [Haloarculaceae archaeon]